MHWVVPEYANRFVSRSGGRVEIGIKSSARWRLVECLDWMVPEMTEGESGEAVAFTVSPNGTGAQRTATATLQADDSEVASVTLIQHPTMDFATSKAAALERALRENKRILLVRGRETCANTRATLFSSLPASTVKPLVDDGYVLWFSNCDVQTDASGYASGLGSYTLPLVCILNPQNMSSYVARATGYQSASDLLTFLQANAGWTGLLAVLTETLASATAGMPYEATLEATGGTPPYAWGGKDGYAEMAESGLPPGLELSESGVLAGTPSEHGTYAFTVVVTDASGVAAQKELTLVVRTVGGEGETTTGTPVAVPHAWLAGYGLGDGTATGYEAAAKAKAANRENTVWECYVAGLDPTNPGAAFRSELVCENGKWKARPVGGKLAGRVYMIEGKKTMADGEGWSDVTDEEDAAAKGWRFFRVEVEMGK